MIVLDTNVLSEALKPSPDKTVVRWLADENRAAVFATAIMQAEILYGIEMLPPEKGGAGCIPLSSDYLPMSPPAYSSLRRRMCPRLPRRSWPSEYF